MSGLEDVVLNLVTDLPVAALLLMFWWRLSNERNDLYLELREVRESRVQYDRDLVERYRQEAAEERRWLREQLALFFRGGGGLAYPEPRSPSSSPPSSGGAGFVRTQYSTDGTGASMTIDGTKTNTLSVFSLN